MMMRYMLKDNYSHYNKAHRWLRHGRAYEGQVIEREQTMVLLYPDTLNDQPALVPMRSVTRWLPEGQSEGKQHFA